MAESLPPTRCRCAQTQRRDHKNQQKSAPSVALHYHAAASPLNHINALRAALMLQLSKISKTFHEASFVSGRPRKPKMPWLSSYSMISTYAFLMLIAAILSFLGAFWIYWPFQSSVLWGVATLLIVLAIAVVFTRSH